MLATYRAGPDELRAFVGPGPILTDDQPLVEYFLSLPRDREVDLRPLKGDVRRIVAGTRTRAASGSPSRLLSIRVVSRIVIA